MNEYARENGIIDVRVDDRMVHGVVASTWLPQSRCTRVMVVNEAASGNDMIRSTLKMSTPGGINLSVLSPEKAIANIHNGNYVNQKVFVIGRYIADIYTLYKADIKFTRVVLGTVSQNEGETLALDKSVKISSREREQLREMRDAGISIICQFKPDDSAKICKEILD